MVKYSLLIVLIAGFFLSLAFISATTCSGTGCSYNNNCYLFGSVINDTQPAKYCAFNGTLSNQLALNSSCSNDFECIGGYCLSDYCTNISEISMDYASIYASYLSASSLSNLCVNVTPGCLNQSSLSNGYNTSKLCYPGYNCYVCSSGYSWSGSACVSASGGSHSSSKRTTTVIRTIINNTIAAFSDNKTVTSPSNNTIIIKESSNDNVPLLKIIIFLVIVIFVILSLIVIFFVVLKQDKK